MIINLINNKKKVCSFNILLNESNLIKYPNENGCYQVTKDMNDICDDSCPICVTNFKIDDCVKKWPECGHIYHQTCYHQIRKEHNIINCPMCRSKLKQIIINKRNYLFFDDYCKINYNETDPIYIDKNGNINIRYKLFCVKYNFKIQDIEYNSFNSIIIIELLKIVSLLSYDNLDEAIYIIKSVLDRYIIYNDDIRSTNGKKYYNYLVKHFKNFSDIDLFKIKNEKFNKFSDEFGYIRLDILLENIINDSLDKLINTTKKQFISNLYDFSNTTECFIWFLINNLDSRKKFFQNKLSKIVGEKYRKIFNALDVTNFKSLINSI
jgi:hypothetical protein